MNRRNALGKPAGALNAPIAAFAMAVVLCSYCISSIHTARREAASSSSATQTSPKRPAETQQTSWVQQALKEQQQEVERKKRG